jgi:hypothetical protein
VSSFRLWVPFIELRLLWFRKKRKRKKYTASGTMCSWRCLHTWGGFVLLKTYLELVIIGKVFLYILTISYLGKWPEHLCLLPRPYGYISSFWKLSFHWVL